MIRTQILKVFERLLRRSLTSYWNRFNIFDFKEISSNKYAILALTFKILESLNNSRPYLCVFMCCKNFRHCKASATTARHQLLLQSFNGIGIKTNILYIFRSYLYYSQSVKQDDVVSNLKTLKWRVLQGPMIGPTLLINLIINSLF